jgi:hypothetical protein
MMAILPTPPASNSLKGGVITTRWCTKGRPCLSFAFFRQDSLGDRHHSAAGHLTGDPQPNVPRPIRVLRGGGGGGRAGRKADVLNIPRRTILL